MGKTNLEAYNPQYSDPIILENDTSAPPPYNPPPYSPDNLKVRESIKGRVKKLSLEDLEEKKNSFFKWIINEIFKLFTGRNSDQCSSYFYLDQIRRNDANFTTEDKIAEMQKSLNLTYSSHRDDFVLMFCKKFLLNDQFDSAVKILELHSNQSDPRVLFLKASLFQAGATEDAPALKLEKGNDSITFTLEEISTLSIEEVKVLSSKEMRLHHCTSKGYSHLINLYGAKVGFTINHDYEMRFIACDIIDGDDKMILAILGAFKESSTLKKILCARSFYHSGDSGLMWLARQGRTEAVQTILNTAEKLGILKEVLATKNKDNQTTLTLAAKNGHIKTVQAIIASAKKSEILKEVLATENDPKNNAYYYAEFYGHAEITQILSLAAQ